jgi:hypothetical protein
VSEETRQRETGKGEPGKGESGHVAINAAIWGVATGGTLLALFDTPAPWWLWAGAIAWLLLWLTALLNLSDGASRAFVAGTLRKSSYTQIYTTLTRRTVMGVWRRVCDPADDRDSVPALFRAALTWRLYDAALLIAVTYPIVLPIAQWIATGEAARVGSAVLAEPAPFWWERAAALGAFVILLLGVIGRKLTAASPRDAIRRTANWLFLVVFGAAFALAFAFAFSLADALADAAVGAVAALLAIGLAGAAALAFALAGAAAAALPGAAAVGVAAALAGAAAVGVAVGGAAAAVFAIVRLDARGQPRLARAGVTIGILAALVLTGAVLDWTDMPEEGRAVFLFLAVLPLLNALVDTLSYAVTLTFLRRGLRARLPLLWGLADLLVACVLFLALGATLVAAVHGLNGLAGVPLVDLGALFAGVYTAPWDYFWLIAMLFSTILPTVLHFLVSLLGLQGLWPRAWRRPVADWIGEADRSALRAVRAALALAFVWWVPLVVLGAGIWGLWALGGGLVRAALALYLEGLLWIAKVPVGAL